MATEPRKSGSAKAAGTPVAPEALEAFRRLENLSQDQIARSLGMSQRSIDRLVSNADLHLSTLRQQIEAAGGTLELRVELPGKGVLHLTGVGV